MNEGTAPSADNPKFVRPDFKNIAPYILVNGAARFIDFLKSAFEATERLRVPRPDGSVMHCEVGVGNSVIELGDADGQHQARPTTVHLYVEDADATFERALQVGASPVEAVVDQPWGDRQGCVRDEFGNLWRIATPNGWTPGPEGILSVQPYMFLRDADKMIPFAEAAFRAVAEGEVRSDDGKVLHATIRIANGTFEIEEAHDEFQPAPCYLHTYVPDVDAAYHEATRAGAKSVEPPNDKPYGERGTTVIDPFGNTWFLATYTGA